MNQPIPTGPDLFGFAEAAYGKAKAAGQSEDNDTYGSPEEIYQFCTAEHHRGQALTAAVVMLTEVVASASGVDHYDLDAWREKIGLTWLKECRGKEIRRPACEKRHTDDCTYADPPPEPKHVLLDVGTRVLVAPLHDPDCVCASTRPYVGKIAGYDMHRTKYQINEECYGRPGEYYDFVKWEFVSNRVAVHPDGPECPPPPKPVKREPTSPQVYVEDRRGKQGYVTEVLHIEKDDSLWYRVQFLAPGVEPVLKRADSMTIIAASQVERCENGADQETG